MKLIRTLFFTPFFLVFFTSVFGIEADSTIHTDHSYSFRPQLLINYMSIGKTKEPRRKSVENQINYRFQEFSLSGYTPIYEKKYLKTEKKAFEPTLSLLFTGSLSSSRSFFQFVDTKPVLRVSAGIRALYFSGNKNIWMLSLAPFISEESRLLKNSVPRFFGSFLYSRMVNEFVSYRLGLSYSYLFNGGTLLPILGLRVGNYQKVYLNIQIPRDVSLVWNINNKFQVGIFSRVSGGIYRFRIDDEVTRFKDIKGKAVLYRTDLLTGIMLNYSPNSQVYFSFNTGFATRRNINVAFTNELIPVRGHVIDDGVGTPSLFLNFSVAFYFGKPTYNGGYNQLIEQKALNNSMDVGDFNLGNNQLTNDMNKATIKDINKKDLQKLNDQYLDVKDFLFDE